MTNEVEPVSMPLVVFNGPNVIIMCERSVSVLKEHSSALHRLCYPFLPVV